MRILCLSIESSSNLALADIFLKFSPRLVYRRPHWLFIDVTPTVSLFRTESLLVDECLNVCSLLNLKVSAALADTAPCAQLLTQYHQRLLTVPGEEHKAIDPLPISSLVWFEGLQAWRWPAQQVMQIASFLQTLGFHTIGQIRSIQREAFHERWGELGVQIWRRLHGLDPQVVSPYIPAEPLHFYQYLEEPVGFTHLLLHFLRQTLTYLFARLQGRNLFAQTLKLVLRCEYSDVCHVLQVSPASPSRDLDLYLTLLEQKLDTLQLDNPIREFEVDLVGCEEKQRQLDFWEPRSTHQEKLQRLISLLQQADCRAGFYQLRNAILPEKTWDYKLEPESFAPVGDVLETDQDTYQVKPAYGKSVLHAPRPTRILKNPKRLSLHEVKSLQVLSRQPIERLEEGWWQEEIKQRDYYFAISNRGQCLWIYRDQKDYFLHGYFD